MLSTVGDSPTAVSPPYVPLGHCPRGTDQSKGSFLLLSTVEGASPSRQVTAYAKESCLLSVTVQSFYYHPGSAYHLSWASSCGSISAHGGCPFGISHHCRGMSSGTYPCACVTIGGCRLGPHFPQMCSFMSHGVSTGAHLLSDNAKCKTLIH